MSNRFESKIIQSFYEKQKYPLDDCYFDGKNVVITTDSLQEETHFKMEWSTPEQIATKLVEVNASDIYSSGAIPQTALLNLGMSSKIKNPDQFLKRFSKSLIRSLQKHRIELVGGDTYRAPSLNVAITLLGKVSRTPWQRQNGRDGDSVYISRGLGLSQLGYNLLKSAKNPKTAQEKAAIAFHLAPNSERELVLELLKKNVAITSCMDITDGLVADSQKLAFASKGKLEIEVSKIPGFGKILKHLSVSEILHSGEELALLFLSPDDSLEKEFASIAKIGSFQKTNSKKLGPEQRVSFFQDGKKLTIDPLEFTHFPDWD